AEGAVATADANDVAEVVVCGRGEGKSGVAHAASEGTIAGADMLVRPLLKPAELVEAVPGLIAAQHSGSGKANQYFLRGFNLDHGTDFTTYIDDVQMNFRTHGHGQGYLDLNGLIPEIINREDFRKGPYRGDGWKANVYGQYYDWNMYSNPVYANPDGTSAQIHQFDRRAIVGLRAEKTWNLGETLQVRLGTENRYDDIDKVGVQQTSARRFV